MIDKKVNVTTLNDILTKLKENKLIVSLAYRLDCTTPTIYNWNQISDDNKALSRLVQISQIDKKRILEDGPVMEEIINMASRAVVAAMPKNN
ncbi:MAG: hypothetical protein Q8N30_04145 [Methylococcales bacterium]|nr:hypothetical protein [Methylococcales bacterium]